MDKTYYSRLEDFEHVQLVFRRSEHPIEGRNLKDSVKASGDPVLRLRHGLTEELVFKKRSRCPIHLCNVFGKSALIHRLWVILHEIEKVMDRRAGNRQHEARNIRECR